jgi:bifunctional non-homologous end joining protein LigD
MPAYVEPMLATLATTPFSDPDWLYEIKWDGFRVQAVVDGGKVRTWTRGLKDAETYFPRLLSPASWIEAKQAIVDGEVVAIDEDGRPDFSLLQTKLGQPGVAGLVYQPFDLLYLDGRLLLDVPLEDRKRLLRSVLKDHPRVRFAAHVEGEGEAFYEAAKTNGLEGMIAKLRRSRYEPGKRSNAWLKLKIRPEQELVIGGWTPGQGNARDLGALAVGYYDDGKLRFAGKVGAGFTGAIRKELLAKMQPLVVDDPPFDPPPPKDYKGRWGGDLGAVTWVRPELVMRAELGGWTRDGVVRQAAYKGLEPGRDATTVRRETAVATTSAVRAAEADAPTPGPPPGDRAAEDTSSSYYDVEVPRGARPMPPDQHEHPWTATDDELTALDQLGK